MFLVGDRDIGPALDAYLTTEPDWGDEDNEYEEEASEEEVWMGEKLGGMI